MKKALVLSGGAALGAFQAGFLYRDRVKYDLICGVSAGALNGAMIAQDKHEEMKELWNMFAVDRQNIYTSKVLSPSGKIKPIALLWEAITSWPLVSMAENLPLKNLINTYMVKGDFKTKLIIGATSLNTFTYYPISSDSLDEENLRKLLVASAAFPGIFSPINVIQGKWGQNYQQMADGGIGYGSSLSDATNWIKKYSTEGEKWHIDIITTRKTDSSYRNNPTNILQILWRTGQIILNNSRKRDLSLFIDRNEQEKYLNFSYRLIQPRNDLAGSLDFTETAIKNSWQHGYELAEEQNFIWQE